MGIYIKYTVTWHHMLHLVTDSEHGWHGLIRTYVFNLDVACESLGLFQDCFSFIELE